MTSDASRKRIGLIGARGYVGAEMIALIAAHPELELAFVSSRERDGRRLDALEPGYVGDLRYQLVEPDDLAAQDCDALVLALPNGKAAPYVAQSAANKVLIDLSADYRFDDSWYYGLPELTRGVYSGERRISNPGCYASAMQLAIAPLRDRLKGPAQCFGVSGYSGAGTSPSDKNNPDLLHDNLMPYSLIGHIHEREVSRQLGHPVEFMPHVASHFRGITMTVNLHLDAPTSLEDIEQIYRSFYADEPLVRVIDSAPWVSRIAGRHHVEIGGFTLSEDGRRLVLVSTLDNLLKGAATQAMQNINLAFGFPELCGLPMVTENKA